MEDKTFYGNHKYIAPEYGPYYSIDEIIDNLKDNVSIHTIIERLELAKKNGYDFMKQTGYCFGEWNCATDITY